MTTLRALNCCCCCLLLRKQVGWKVEISSRWERDHDQKRWWPEGMDMCWFMRVRIGGSVLFPCSSFTFDGSMILCGLYRTHTQVFSLSWASSQDCVWVTNISPGGLAAPFSLGWETPLWFFYVLAPPATTEVNSVFTSVWFARIPVCHHQHLHIE